MRRRRLPTGMHPFVVVVLCLASVAPLFAASLPLHHHSHFINNSLRRNSDQTPPPPAEYIEVGQPLPTDSITPSCVLPILSDIFGNTVGLHPINASYSAPSNCAWSRAVVHLSAASNGSQHGRISAVWLSGAEILRTSTPESATDGVFWNVRKDVTRYSSLLRQSNLTLSIMLENAVDDFYAGAYSVNLTLLYYDVGSNVTSNGSVNFPLSVLPPNRKSMIRKLRLGVNPEAIASINSMELDENPADLIIPISARGDEGFWFKIQSEYDAVYQRIQIPANAYRAVIEVYVSSHYNDEFWYSNPPDSYIEMNHLPTKRGHGAFREVLVKIDNSLVGSVIPFPVIFAGGINPLFWKPVVAIGAFNLPSYEMELTPFLGILLDGRKHYFGLGVADAISFWLLDANLHLWLDGKVDKVMAGAIKYGNPSSCHVERESKFQQLDGVFETEGKKKTEFSGWVNSSDGNITTHVWQKLKYENTIKFKKNGTEKEVEQKVKVTSKVTVKSDTGETLVKAEVERKYPLKMTTTSLVGSGKSNYLMLTKLEHSMKEEKKNETYKSSLSNSQKSNGWMFVADHDVVSGAARMDQRYEFKDNLGCYSREVLDEAGSIKNDRNSSLCAAAAS